MKVYYSDIFVLPLPPAHRFPMRKYRRLRERIVSEGVLPADNLLIPDAATDEQIRRCHSAGVPIHLHREAKHGSVSNTYGSAKANQHGV